MLTGGGDIHPSFYEGMAGILHSYAGKEPGDRCVVENHMIDKAIELKIPIIGICRGFQWICVKAGGVLVQNVIGHSHYSGVNVDGEIYYANSLHHQMICPLIILLFCP